MVLGVVLSLSAATTGDDEARKLTRETGVLETELSLAKSGEFYLELDVAARELRLMLGGIELQGYPTSSIEIGAPRFAFFEHELPHDWTHRVWTGGRLEPERERERYELKVVEGVPPPEPPVPLTPEEMYPRPYRFFVRYAEGPALEIRPEGAQWGFKEELRARLADLREALPGGGAGPRIRIALGDQDASRLYRALPPETRFYLRVATD